MNLDGVLLEDTFSPVIRRLAVAHGVAYTRELESAVLSQPRRVAARVLARAIGSGVGAGRVTGMYFAERERYVREHPVRLTAGALELVGRLRGLGWDVVCYGGLGERHFDRYLGAWRSWFSGPGYVCTDGFRPGIAEIARGCFGLEPSRVLFIDDVARFAVHARAVRAPFIGHPSSSGQGFQREAMREAGVRHLVHRLDAIDATLLHTLDREAALDTVWPPEHPTPTPTSTGTPALADAGMSAGAGLVPAGKSVLVAGAGSGVGAGAGAAACVGGGRLGVRV
ncbi:HAD family phosphatase [Streptomyces sp. NPDC026665]|uniref:HAD family phosphatase n=1 Tax=Streptomyces sp. NPDC026665 TaxID=3154798 RepID=UPI0033CA97C9